MKPLRRQVLAGLATAPFAPALAQSATRVAALDWALISTLIGLGRPPIGVGEPDLYRRWVVQPPIPAGAVDLGLRVQPNPERLTALAPDLILIGPLTEPARPLLERIAPTRQYNAFTTARRPLDAWQAIVRDLGHRTGGDADALLGSVEASFDRARVALAGIAGRRLILVNLLDERHLNVYGRGSLFADVVARLGLVSAWDRETTIWGTSAAGVEALADHPDADLVLVEPIPPGAGRILDTPGLWRSLAALRGGHTFTLPAAWPFGDLMAAVRLADLLVEAYRSRAS